MDTERVAVIPDVQPLVRELPSSWKPLRVLAAVERLPHTVFLESAGEEHESCEWTILAFDPAWRLELRDGALRRIQRGDGGIELPAVVLPGHPLDALAAAWPARAEFGVVGAGAEPGAGAGAEAPKAGAGAPIPFVSGLAGYLSYDLKDWIERYPSRAVRESLVPDLSLGYYDVAWAWQRSTGKAWIVATGLPEADPAWRATRAETRLEEQWRVVEAAIGAGGGDGGGGGGGGADEPAARDPELAAWLAGPPPVVESNFTRASYRDLVARALDHIAAGDVYQVNLAQRFRVSPAPPARVLYRALREAAPSPFLAFVSMEGGAGLASSSPERFFRIEGDRIETWPIKGTRPRGATPEEDAALAGELRRSEKDRAENVMIVDLERNDLGKVCVTGSVHVSALCEVTSHSNVHHLISRVEGQLRDDAGPVDVLRAMFPGGSITGAPKIRSIEVIDELEPVRRGLYTGAIGYWDVGGDCDWNIAIRTVVAGGGAASFHAGGGIVADSVPDAEYEETLVKASGMMRALGVKWEE
jgi:para-aminobenzoate synthetase component 1